MLGRRKQQTAPPAATDSLGSIELKSHREFMPLTAELRARLERQLQILALRSASPEYAGTAVAFVAQAHRDRDGSYGPWRAYWNRRLQSEPTGLYSAETWPTQVEPLSWSVVLLPVEPGVVRSSAAVVQPGRRARRAGTATKGSQLPLSLSGNPVAAQIDDRMMRGRTPHDIAMSLVSSWIRMTRDDQTLSLQAPVLETAQADGTVMDRELVTWDLTWPLRAPAIDVPPPVRDPRLEDRQVPASGRPAVRALRRRRR